MKKLVVINLENKVQQTIDLTTVSKEELEAFMNGEEGSFLFLFLSDKRNEKAVVLCPGGGFRRVNLQHEGADFAEWFDQQNVSLAVLKYRLPEGDRDRPIADVTKACHTLRGGINGISFRKIGCMGASIGGYMAAYAAITGLADFQIVMYSVFSMEDNLAHKPSRERMFGATLSPEEARSYSLYYKVNENTAPAFIVAVEDDHSVNPVNSFVYAESLIKNHVPVSFHIYPTGGHSFGFNDSFLYKDAYLNELKQWLETL
jgi:acetyl esterase/lipase